MDINAAAGRIAVLRAAGAAAIWAVIQRRIIEDAIESAQTGIAAARVITTGRTVARPRGAILRVAAGIAARSARVECVVFATLIDPAVPELRDRMCLIIRESK